MHKMLILLFVVAFTTAAAAQSTEAARLHQLFADEWEWLLRNDPETATFLGDSRFNDRLTNRSAEAFARRRTHAREALSRLEAIDRSKLTAEDKLNYDLFLFQLRNVVEGNRFPAELTPVNQMGGIHTLMADLAQVSPRETVRDYEDFLTRMRAFPRAVDETIALMRRGAAAGITPPRAIVDDVDELIANQLVDDPAKSPIYELAFAEFRPGIPAAEHERLRKEAREVLSAAVMPAIRKLHTYWRDEYYASTRESIAWSDVPEGREWYGYLARMHTTTPLTPDQIHDLGLSEVKRIRGDMETIKSQTGFEGTLEEFFTFLRTDPRFFYTTREDLLAAYRDISKRIDPELMRLFGRLPRVPYGVIPVPAYSEKTQTTAYYHPGSLESHRAGYYFVNLYKPETRPKWEMEALSLHEAVPGHHLQISLAQELEDVPRFRRETHVTAFVEGWALYAESLGPELGMYTDPYSKFGQLTYEMWRAVRLVVDTGMHMKGWTRQQAIDFFAANSSKPLHDIEVEIDRYIAWPGQALAYKIGELEIKELRARAERQLGDRFDIRAFHDTVLGAGSLPLAVLETRIEEWIVSQKSGEAKAVIRLTIP